MFVKHTDKTVYFNIMLHKKTEYRIQFNKLNTDLRRKIWEDNITARKSRQVTNQATHYWEFQMRDENCECEMVDEEDDHGPLPANRQKHKALCEQYEQQLKPHVTSVQKDAREMAVQTPEWSGDEPDSRLGLGSTSEDELMKNMSSITLPSFKENPGRPISPTPPKTLSVNPRTARSLSRPTRTNLKQYSDSKQTHFVPFGWNEKKTNVGQKQTYNVTAPKKEVHDTARQASQRRKAEVERFLAQEKNAPKQHVTRPRERTTSTSSSQWMSEYQDKFSVKSYPHSSRAQSAPPAPRPPVTWRRS